MKSRNVVAVIFFSNLIALTPSYSQVQQGKDENFRQNIFAEEALDSFDFATPLHVYYLYLFRKIQDDPPIYLTESDKEIILNLPSHKDRSLVQSTILTLQGQCERMESARSDDQIKLIASEFDQGRLDHDAFLNNHYAAVMDQLSAQTKKELELAISALIQSKKISYARIKVVGAASRNPSVFKSHYLAGCEAIRNIPSTGLDEGLKLIDEYHPGIPLKQSDETK